MFKPSIILLSLIVVSCSSSPFKEQTKKQDMITEHLSQGRKYVGGEFDQRFSSSGNDGMTLQTVGKSVYPVSTNEALVRANAISSAKFKLIESAPTEFKSIVQQAIGNSLGYTGEFNKIDTSITEVRGLRGIEVREQDIDCKIMIEANVDGGYNNFRECRAIARVPLVELTKAFNFTLDSKYGPQQKSQVEKILEEQLRSSVSNNSGRRAASKQ